MKQNKQYDQLPFQGGNQQEKTWLSIRNESQTWRSNRSR